LISIVVLSCGSAPILTGYDFNFDLSTSLSNGTSTVSNYTYTVYYSIRTGNINIGIVAQEPNIPSHWVALGFSNTGNMTKTDAAIAWVDPASGNVSIADFWIQGKKVPSDQICQSTGGAVCPDSLVNCTNNVALISGSRNGGFLVIEYSRPLAASDACDIAINPGFAMNITFSMGPVNQTLSFPYNLMKHSVRTDISQGPHLMTFNLGNSGSSSNVGTSGSSNQSNGTSPSGNTATSAPLATSAVVGTTVNTSPAATTVFSFIIGIGVVLSLLL